MRDAAQRRFKLIVFDWDGTLADSTAIIAEAIQGACRDVGEPVPDDVAARFVIGLGLAEALRTSRRRFPVHRHSELAARYRHHYLAREDDIPLFDGAAELLEDLDAGGYMLAVATGKTRAGSIARWRKAGWRTRFHATRCADEGLPKPHPDMLLHLMERLGVDAARDADDRRHDARSRARAQCRRRGGRGRVRRARAGGARAAGAAGDRAFDRRIEGMAGGQRLSAWPA